MIRDSDMFFGRADILRLVYSAVANRQSISVVGPRGIGKSSFLRYASLPEVQVRFPYYDLSRHIFVFFDLREYLRKTAEDFFHNVSQVIIAQGAKMNLTLNALDRGEDEFSNILDQVENHGFFPVLLMDAFDKVTLNQYFDYEFFAFLRAHASAGLVSYVTSSVAPLYEVSHSGIAGSPFFNIFSTCKLGALLPEEAKALITMPAQQAGMPFSDSEVDLVLKLAGRHPFFLQRICYLLYEQKLLQDNGKINIQDLKNQAYRELNPVFEDIWGQLSDAQQGLLQDEAQQKEKRQRGFPELSESALFRQFVRKTCQVNLFRMTSDELEDALLKIDEPGELGKVGLRLTKMVSQRLSEDRISSDTERGVVIREVLNESLDGLRGEGIRTDSAPDWRFYNILYYRYFKYNLKSEQIAARLGFTIRQFYRERNRALKALLNVLFEMERVAAGEED